MNEINSQQITPDESDKCVACGVQLQMWTDTQTGDNLPPGGLTETFIECPSGCDIPDSEVL